MNKSDIVIIEGKQGPYHNVINALKIIDLSCVRGKNVLIKPNVGRSAKPERGYNAHSLAIAGVIPSFI